MIWHQTTPWGLHATPGLEWVAPWAKRRHIPLSTTLRDGIRMWLRGRLAQTQTDAALEWVITRQAPSADWELDIYLDMAVEIGRQTAAYSHDPMPAGERSRHA